MTSEVIKAELKHCAELAASLDWTIVNKVDTKK